MLQPTLIDFKPKLERLRKYIETLTKENGYKVICEIDDTPVEMDRIKLCLTLSEFMWEKKDVQGCLIFDAELKGIGKTTTFLSNWLNSQISLSRSIINSDGNSYSEEVINSLNKNEQCQIIINPDDKGQIVKEDDYTAYTKKYQVKFYFKI